MDFAFVLMVNLCHKNWILMDPIFATTVSRYVIPAKMPPSVLNAKMKIK